MLSDGHNSFTWNARNQVAALNSVSLQYDALGRRIKNGAGTSFLYDGANAAQELSGSTVTASLLSGGVDEVFARNDSSGSFTPLKDALGSTIALVDSSGNIAASYSYDPFGNTTASGTPNANEFQYTGRENEGNGLYYYRARYYSPLLGRFVSQDPLGFLAGANFYAYLDNSPVNGTDPLGLHSTDAHNQIIWNALHGCAGVSEEDIWQMQQGSHWVDQNFQGPEFSYMHAMSDGDTGQTAADAQSATRQFIAQSMSDATRGLDDGFRNVAMWNFGVAMHPVMDYSSPAHTDRHGDPIPWCGLTGGCSNTRKHGGDSDPPWNPLSIENLKHLNANPAIQDFETMAIRNWFQELTGATCSPMPGRK
jgi:RHS repeat-associated protein